MQTRFTSLALILVLAALILSACRSASPVANQQLRIVNSGSADIQALTVLFPGPTADALAARVPFGDVAAGDTTGYRDLPGGVYRYAAYEYTLKGQTVTQPVTDWVGERPMPGRQLTYRITRDTQEHPGNQIKLEQVTVDQP